MGLCIFLFFPGTNPSVRMGWTLIPSVPDGVSVSETPPSVNRNGWSRTDRYGYPKTDRTSVQISLALALSIHKAED